MKRTTNLAASWTSAATVAFLIGCLFLAASSVAQSLQGLNAVFNSSGNCSPTSPCAGSSAFIDASMFISSQYANVCAVLNGILNGTLYKYPSTGAIIDARGISGTAALTCSTSPWSGSITTPSTILLPQGPIVMGPTWVLPRNTHLIGEGDNDPAASAISTPGTTIQASSSTSGAMIQFASASGASGISVERLTLDGAGKAISGIVNQNAGNNT